MTETIQDTLQGKSSNTAPQKPVQYMDTVEAYNKWAEVYDTDGNFLQALDTIQLRSLLPLFLDKVTHSHSRSQAQPQPTRLIDLGCGTGRNTLQLLQLAPLDAEIIGLDASPGMLEVARAAIARNAADRKRQGGIDVVLELFDLLASPPAPSEAYCGASAVISTLVAEHIPLQAFFGAAAAVLRPGGYLLVTNMHSEMGAISQAGFVDVTTGTKIRPTSYCHTVRDVLVGAESAGFEVERLDGEDVREVRVDEGMVEVLGRRAEKWVGVKVWFGICFRKRL
ncbi:class I SAM-dependent DNA methyltransferase [Aspergillus clavatus NRRL 1]|uniref:Methyltransferase small domain protein n=1 Tax=Aspergillus clavatus (strain ATCC 1007 / CBS 513.65 / DSM 816 / NCTC 3887 / NRRL 1 / QM 1276 / 107) TaxID=344612 RepID=A1CPE4_ASPCL|nr:methyltransferase small domain protein [Aspergillus clavatus NRRL 1]EAW07515.1 methyltransferase small domain protein [Aspergillus clavatus NRRL 1]